MSDALIGYFGYGSLVNRQTLRTDYVSTHRASLSGWRRHWQSRGVDMENHQGRQIALLSIHRNTDAMISGMLVIDRKANLDAVDLREARYDRVAIAREDLQLHDYGTSHGSAGELPDELYVYVGRNDAQSEAAPDLLQSYLDAVMAGFLTEYGEAGVHHFLETTVGFDRRVIADRHDPLYPRAVVLERERASWFDHLLTQHGAIFAP